MKCTFESDHPVNDAAAKQATGKTMEQWYKELDAQGGVKLGRAKMNKFLYNEQGVDPWWSTTIVVEYEKAHDIKKKDGLYEGYTICATKTIAAPLEDSYSAWVDNSKLAQWFGAGAKVKAEDGGELGSADGDKATMLRVRPNKDLRFDWEHNGTTAPSRVDVQFSDKGKGKTGIIVTHSRLQTRPEADGARNAWGEALDRLKSMLEK